VVVVSALPLALQAVHGVQACLDTRLAGIVEIVLAACGIFGIVGRPDDLVERRIVAFVEVPDLRVDKSFETRNVLSYVASLVFHLSLFLSSANGGCRAPV
jgi:hypothetical protein